jgi:hypothetical protein
MNKIVSTLSLVAGLSLGALTADAASISRVSYYPFYNPDRVSEMASTGQVPVTVIGSPFQTNDLIAQLSLPGFYPSARMVATPIAVNKGPHLVLAFDIYGSTDGTAVCRAPEKVSQRPTGGQMNIQAAFCFNDEVVSEAMMVTQRTSDAADPAFKLAMSRLLEELLTSRDSERVGGCENVTC